MPAPLPERPGAAAEDRHERDVHLVALCLQGDDAAWAELLTRHRPLIMTIARRHGLQGDAADDLFQATCVTLLERLELLRDSKSLAAWIATTATRACWRRGRRATTELPKDVTDTREPPDRAFLLEARDAAVRQAVEALGEPCRSLLRGLFDEEEPYEAVARRLGLAMGSVGVYRRRCLERLRASLSAQGWKEAP